MADQLCGVWFLQSVSPELAADVGLTAFCHYRAKYL